MGHYLTLCTHIYICNTQIVVLETEKVEKITQDSDVNTELVVTENESMYPNIEFTRQIKVCSYLKANKPDCIEP